MTIHSISNFSVTGWDQTPYGEETAHLGRATVKKVFTGDLDGESVAELLLCQANPEDFNAGAGYVAMERVTGQLGGRKGTFVFQHGGLNGGGNEPYTFGQIIPGTGTGELVGLRGTVEISVTPEGGHTITLDYDID